MKNRLFILTLSFLLLLTACDNSPNTTGEDDGGIPASGTTPTIDGTQNTVDMTTPHSQDIFAMDTFMNVTAYGTAGETALPVVSAEIQTVEQLLSVTIEDSDIATANKSVSAVTVSDTTAEVISAALDLCRRTEGALDISIYPIVRAWGFTTDSPSLPEDNVIRDRLTYVDYKKIELQGTSLLVPENMMIDVGAVAKGYLSDRLSKMLKDSGVSSALINLGGNVQTLGAKPDGSPWRIAVQDPFDPTNLMAVAEVADKAVITSGGYERFFEHEGESYWHIMDPDTGYPANNGTVSVTIIGDSGMLCDGLSTALFIMGVDRALEHYAQHRDFEAVFVTEDKEIIITPGLADCFSVIDEAGFSLQIAEIN